MSLSAIVLWRGTRICEQLGVDLANDAGLIRWMINTLIYLVLALAFVWVIAM